MFFIGSDEEVLPGILKWAPCTPAWVTSAKKLHKQTASEGPVWWTWDSPAGPQHMVATRGEESKQRGLLFRELCNFHVFGCLHEQIQQILNFCLRVVLHPSSVPKNTGNTAREQSIFRTVADGQDMKVETNIFPLSAFKGLIVVPLERNTNFQQSQQLQTNVSTRQTLTSLNLAIRISDGQFKGYKGHPVLPLHMRM